MELSLHLWKLKLVSDYLCGHIYLAGFVVHMIVKPLIPLSSWYGMCVCVCVSRRQLLLWPSQRCSAPALADSQAFSDLVFTSHTSTVYAHTTHTLLALRHNWQDNEELSRISSTVSSSYEEGDNMVLGSQGVRKDVGGGVRSCQRLCVLTTMPKFLVAYCPKACH